MSDDYIVSSETDRDFRRDTASAFGADRITFPDSSLPDPKLSDSKRPDPNPIRFQADQARP